jgi:hypothetical protein
MSEYTEAVEIAAEAARARFNSWRRVAVKDEGPLPDDVHDALQIDVMRRRVHGGPIGTHGAALRVLQELGATFEESDGDPQLAGLGRLLVAAGELAITQGMALVPIVGLVADARDPNVGPCLTPTGAAGALARACIEDGPRNALWRANFACAIAVVLAAGADFVEINSNDGAPVDLLELYRIVATELLAPLPPYKPVGERLAELGVGK